MNNHPEYNLIFEKFAFPETKALTKGYLDKYWLSELEYNAKWKPIQDTIFVKDFDWFPNNPINPMFSFKILGGGLLFTEKTFNKLIEFSKEFSDRYFVIIEDDNNSFLRFKFPTNVCWNEINMISNGNIETEGMSYELFGRPIRNYYVFGDSGHWGKYVANDLDNPIDIIAYKEEDKNKFDKIFNK
ncbi:MAG: hypothetical protein K1X55_10230 [Chitinophagales bacterium]|nr:hypothetical protein [Chitinophagales bacterium]